MHYGKNKYLYRAFGLKIASDFYLPELIKSEDVDEIDINIIKDTVPTRIDKIIWEEEGVMISQNELILEIKNVAKYYIVKGNTIVVEPNKNAHYESVKLYLLGAALGIILLQRDIVPVHGSAVVINGKAVIFSGVSGVGKSTLSSAFRMKGYSFLADDISVVVINKDGIPVVEPSYPQQKLWGDSLKILGEDNIRISKTVLEEGKYEFQVQKEFLNSPVQLDAIFEISDDECSNVEVNQIFGTDKLNILLRNIYRGLFLKIVGLKSEYFRQCLEISNNTKFFKLVRPKGMFSLEEQISIIKERLISLV